MRYHWDNAPVGQTCPDINEAQRMSKKAIEGMESAISELQDLIDGLEKLRKENEELRYWGNEQYDRAENAEKELSDANKRIDELENEVSILQDQIKELEQMEN